MECKFGIELEFLGENEYKQQYKNHGTILGQRATVNCPTNCRKIVPHNNKKKQQKTKWNNNNEKDSSHLMEAIVN